MRYPIFILIMLIMFAFSILACGERSPSPQEKPTPSPPAQIIVEKEKEEIGRFVPSEVKIKLKRDGKNNYSWELSGSDVDQILKVDDKLKKKLGGEQAK